MSSSVRSCLDALKNWGYDIAVLESPADVAARVRYVRDVGPVAVRRNLRSDSGGSLVSTGDCLPLAAGCRRRVTQRVENRWSSELTGPTL
jgi:hypothetical protein